jgi:hypothetical protein
MTIEVEDIVQSAAVDVENFDVETAAVVETVAAVDIENVDVETAAAVDVAPKKRGRPAGAKNKAKVDDTPVTVQAKKKKAVVPPPPPSESESESEEPLPPPSPSTERRNQWTAYRQKQVDNYQARQAHYLKKLDKMLGF